MPIVTNIKLSGDVRIDGLLSGYSQWAGDSITYSIATGQSVWSDYPVSHSFPTRPEYAVPNLMQAANIRAAVASWASVIATPVEEIVDNAAMSGQIRFAFSLDPLLPTASLGTYPGPGVGGDVWLNNSSAITPSGYEIGSGYYLALLHEIGHALGLKHSFDSTPMNGAVLDELQSTRQYTVMAYENVVGYPSYGTTFFPTTPMPFDLLAIQYLYGKNALNAIPLHTTQFCNAPISRNALIV